MAAIIYWQAREISRIVKECNPEEAGIDISLLAHISPIEWRYLYSSCEKSHEHSTATDIISIFFNRRT